jgi:AraC-like DNA-binding protein
MRDELSGVLAGRLDVRVLIADVNHITPHNWSHRLSATHWRLYQHNAPGGFLDEESGRTWKLLARRVYLIPPGLELNSRCQTSFRQLYLHFDVLGFAALSAQQELFPGPVAVPAAKGFETAVSTLADWRESEGAPSRDVACQNPARECWVRGVLCEALGRYLSSLPHENVLRYQQRLVALRPFLPALDFVSSNLGAPITNGVLAARCGMSEDHFIRRFRAAAGVPPAQYVLQRRIARAAELLLSSDQSIELIAEQTGFCDRYYFTRVFTHATGRSPALFRRGGV